MKTIFIVDDNDVNLIAAEKALSEKYDIFTLPSAADMFELLENVIPDLILLDIMMPGIDGITALKRLKADKRYENIPVVFLTGKDDANTEAMGFELGAVDFIAKPFSGLVLLNRIKTHLNIEDIIRERTDKLQRVKNSIVSVLVEMLESSDRETGGHVERSTIYLKLLIENLMHRGIYAEELSDWDLEMAVSSARLHDVGKIVVSDILLNKPGKLTKEEFELVKAHVAEGERIIDKVIKQTGDEDFLFYAKLFAGYHHERWNGTGYPRGLKGEEIPLHGRIMALVDVYDALISVRPYKEAYPHENAVEIIRKESGQHFDPKIVEVFLEANDLFAEARVD